MRGPEAGRVVAMAALKAQADAAAIRGSLLFHLFLAEAMAGDALAASALDGVRGWAIDVGPDGYEVAALGGAAGGEVVRRVSFAVDGAPRLEAAGEAASPRQTALAAAREAGAEAARAHPQRFASIVAPPPRDGRTPRELDVYLVRLADRPIDVALGPHWRLRVDAEAGEVREALAVCTPDRVAAGAGARGAPPLAVVHEDGPAPSELHVFLSLQHGLVLEVATPMSGLRWRVEGEAVTPA